MVKAKMEKILKTARIPRMVKAATLKMARVRIPKAATLKMARVRTPKAVENPRMVRAAIPWIVNPGSLQICLPILKLR